MALIIDASLAVLHHWLAFGLLGLLMAEWALLRLPPTSEAIRLLPRIDLFYGLCALGLLIIGGLRVSAGLKPPEFYSASSLFWIKIGLFALAGLLSITPTLRYLRWRKQSMNEAAMSRVVLPDITQWQATRRWVVVQLHLLAGVIVCAALMARGVGL